MLLRRASQLIIGDYIDVATEGQFVQWWCVENVAVSASPSDDGSFIHLILSNRQRLSAPQTEREGIELRRMTVRRKDYLSIDIRYSLRPFKSE